MGMGEIWERLAPETRDWLIANNGDAVPVDIAAQIDELVDATSTDDVWESAAATDAYVPMEPDDEIEDAAEDPGARYLTDDAVDWIEGNANGE